MTMLLIFYLLYMMVDINGKEIKEGDTILYKLGLDYHRGTAKFYNNALRIVARDIIIDDNSIKKYNITVV